MRNSDLEISRKEAVNEMLGKGMDLNIIKIIHGESD